MPRRSIAWLGLALLLGCAERSRLTFQDSEPSDFTGPTTTIDQPAADTVLLEGGPFILAGRVIDSSGVDTVYFDVEGIDHSLLPLPGEGRDTVRFGLPLATLGLGGRTLTVQVFGVDLFGNRGARVIRQLKIE